MLPRIGAIAVADNVNRGRVNLRYVIPPRRSTKAERKIIVATLKKKSSCVCHLTPLSEFHPRLLLQLASDPAPSERHPMGPDLRGAIRRNDSRLFSLPPTIVIARYYLLLTSSSPFPSSFYNIYILFDLQKPWLIPYSIHDSNSFQPSFPTILSHKRLTSTLIFQFY